MKRYDLLVIGGGAAGMAAALAASGRGRKILLTEREPEFGGILNQCIHRGFGRAFFQEDLTGPEYAERFIRKIKGSGIILMPDTTVLSLFPDKTALLSGPEGLQRVVFDKCILAAGCRERTLESLDIAGTRPAGIFTAGTAQQLMNRGGYKIGKQIVILGCGDFGQIMARQFVLSGYQVTAMVEQKDHPGGMERNRKECLEAYSIPILTGSTIDEILGRGRISGVAVRNLKTGIRRNISCDTLVTALGLIPDRSLCRSLENGGQLPSWLRLCGNCESVHEIVDNVSRDAMALGAGIF